MLAISRAGRAFSVFVLCSPVLARAEDPLPRVLTTVAGFDNGEDAPLRDIVITGPMGITFDAAGNLYFTDLNLGVVRRMDAATGRDVELVFVRHPQAAAGRCLCCAQDGQTRRP